MSAALQTKGGASAPSNVVRLPTAAPHKVKQRWNRWTAAERDELPQFPRERTTLARWPWLRDSLPKARAIQEVEQTPALMLAAAMFKMLPESDQQNVRGLLSIWGLKHCDATHVAEWLEYTSGRMTNVQRQDIRHALDMLASGEVE